MAAAGRCVALLLLALLAGSRATSRPTSRRGRSSRASTSCATRPASTSASCCSTSARATATCAPSRSAWRNTLRVALAGIVLASVLGVVVGMMRLSHHPLVAGLVRRLRRALPQHPAADPAARDLPARHRAAARGLERRISIEGVALLSKEGLQIAVPDAGRLRAALRGSSPFAVGGGARLHRRAPLARGRRRPDRARQRRAWRRSAPGCSRRRPAAGRGRCSTAS